MTKKDADAIKVLIFFLFLFRKLILINFQKAILEAKSIEEVERLKAMLQAGQMPNSMGQQQHQNGHKSNPEAMEHE